jgi:outer membrane protein TolC
MRTAFIAILTGYALLGSAHAQRALTFDEAMRLARDNNKDLKAARTRIDQARVGIEQARAALLPTLAVQGKYTRNAFEAKLDFQSQAELTRLQNDVQVKTVMDVYNKLGQVQPGLGTPSAEVVAAGLALQNYVNSMPPSTLGSGEIIIQPFDQLDFNASLNLPLVVPWAYDSYSAARKQTDAAKAQYGVSEVQLLNAAATAFYGAAGTEELVQARKNAITVAQKTLDNAKARLEAGVVNRVEVTRAEIAVVRARQALREAEDQRANAYQSLSTLLQLREPYHVQVGAPGALSTTPVDELAREGMNLRPEANAFRKTLEVAELQKRSSTLRWVPTLSGFGLFRAFNYAGFVGQNYNWSVGLQLDWLLYDGGLRDAGRHLAEHQAKENQLRLDALRDTITDEIANARRAVETKRKALDAAMRAVQLSKETLDLVRVQHDAGTATQLDLLTAQDALVLSEVAVAQARFDIQLADITLQRAAGLFPAK